MLPGTSSSYISSMQEHLLLLRQAVLLFALPLLLFTASILFAGPSWRVAAFVGALWYLLPALRGRVLLAYISLAAAGALWVLLSSDTALAFPVALLPLLLAACVPGRRYGSGDDWNPAPGVSR